jgi:tetratricopeptide (TPR) repeat protein
MQHVTRVLLGASLAVFTASASNAQCTGDAQRAFRVRELDEAKAAAKGQLEKNPRDAGAHYCMGRVADAQSRSGEAVDWFEKAVSLDERNAEYHLWLGNALGEEAQKANKLRQPFLARRVKAEFERAVELDSANLDARHGLIQFYSVAPGIMGGSMEKARAQAAAIARLNPMRGHTELAQLLEREKDVAGAEREYVAGIAAAPDSMLGYYALGSYYQRQKRWSDAFATYENALARKPNDVVARVQIGRAAAVSGENLDVGERHLASVLASPPDDFPPISAASVHYRLGNIYERQGKPERARTEYIEALRLNPKNEDARKSLAGLK